MIRVIKLVIQLYNPYCVDIMINYTQGIGVGKSLWLAMQYTISFIYFHGHQFFKKYKSFIFWL